ncbi:nucleic acid-binding, OB-fold protein, partial [Tanacetum coccineum]
SKLPEKSGHQKPRVSDSLNKCQSYPHSSLLSAPVELQNSKLSATSATHYYINLRTPEAEYAYRAQCNKKSTEQDGIYTCEDHGRQDPLTYRYNFKAKVTDGSAIAKFTFFTKAAEKIDGRPCSKLAEKYRGTNQQRLPSEIVCINGKKQIFQVQYTPSTRKGAGEFTVVDILDIQPAIETQHIGAVLATSTSTATEASTSKDKGIPETPPQDIIEQTTDTIISTISFQKSKRESARKGSGSIETATEIEPAIKDNPTMVVTTSSITFHPQEKPEDVPKETEHQVCRSQNTTENKHPKK